MNNLFLILILFSLLSCNPDNEPCRVAPSLPEVLPSSMPDNFFNYYWFEKGSYWILQETENKLVDSIYVDSTSCGFDTSLPKYCESPTIIGIECRQYTSRTLSNAKGGANRFSFGYPNYYEYYSGGAFFGFDDSSPFIEEDISVPAGTFSKTKRIEFSIKRHPDTDSLIQFRLNYAKGIGIVRRENITDSITWELLRHKSIQ